MDIRQYLHGKGYSWKETMRSSGKVAIMNCPFCGDKEKKFAISLQDGAFNCLHLNSCGVKGSWWNFQEMLGDKPMRLDTDNFIKHPIQYERPNVHAQALSAEGIKFFSGRGINREVLKKFRIGEKDGAIMFPYFKKDELVNVKYRQINEKKFWKEKNAEPTLFNRDNCSGEALAICEGEIDCASLAQYEIDAVSVPSGISDMTWIENEWDYLDQFQKIYLFMDNDEAGQKGVWEIVRRLGAWRCFSVILPFKDANECLMNDVPVESIVKAIENAKEFDPEILKKAKDFEDEIIDLFEHPEKLYGIETKWKGLNDLIRGWRDEELTIWSGRNASGKSTMINDEIINLLRKEHRVIIASLEMPPKRYLRWMIMNIAEKRNVEADEVRKILSENCQNLFIFNNSGEVKGDDLIDVFDFAARKYGVKHFFIDSLMKISLPTFDLLESQKIFCNALIDKLAVQHKGHVHLVAHPRKSFKDMDKPDKVDISGSGDITNLAHNVLMVWRPDQEAKEKAQKKGGNLSDATLYVKKNREWGQEGYVNFNFDIETKKFTEV